MKPLLFLRHLGLRRPERKREGYKPLLRTVVKVAFDPAPSLISRGDDPRTGCRQLSTALGVGDRHGRQLGEAEQALLGVVDEALRLLVSDDGVGGADPSRGSGLVGLSDRVEAVGGTIGVTSRPGRGTSLLVTIPLPPGCTL